MQMHIFISRQHVPIHKQFLKAGRTVGWETKVVKYVTNNVVKIPKTIKHHPCEHPAKLWELLPKRAVWRDSPAVCGWTLGWWHCRVFLFLTEVSHSSVATGPLTSQFPSVCLHPWRLQSVDSLQEQWYWVQQIRSVWLNKNTRKYSKYHLCMEKKDCLILILCLQKWKHKIETFFT